MCLFYGERSDVAWIGSASIIAFYKQQCGFDDCLLLLHKRSVCQAGNVSG